MPSSWYERGYSIGRRWRWTVLVATLAFFAGAIATFYWHSEVFNFLLAPADKRLSPFDGKPVVTAPTSMFGATLGLSLAMGKVAAFPFLAVGFLALIKPLTPFNWWRRFVAINAAVAFLLFVTGVIFVYYVMLPVSMNFLLSFGVDVAEPIIILDLYLELLFSLFKWIGIIFLLPLAMNILARVEWLTYQRAKGFYRVGFFLTLFFSAIISPGLDGFLTMLVAGAMYSLYLVGLGAVWAVHPEEGNYLWFWTIRNAALWAVRKPMTAYRWVGLRLRQHGLIW